MTPEERQMAELIIIARDMLGVEGDEIHEVGPRQLIIMFVGFMHREQKERGGPLSRAEVLEAVDKFLGILDVAGPLIGLKINL